MFSWDNVPGNDSNRLRKFLMDDLDIDWVESAEIHKSDDGKTIHILKNDNSAEIMIDEVKENATLKIRDGRTYKLKVKKEKDKLNIYMKLKHYIETLFPKDIFEIDVKMDMHYEVPPEVPLIIIAFSLAAFYSFSKGFFTDMGKDAWKLLKTKLKEGFEHCNVNLEVDIGDPNKRVVVYFSPNDKIKLDGLLEYLVENRENMLNSKGSYVEVTFNELSRKWIFEVY